MHPRVRETDNHVNLCLLNFILFSRRMQPLRGSMYFVITLTPPWYFLIVLSNETMQ